jgi:MmyB-like transcription regulator ligand binding domain
VLTALARVFSLDGTASEYLLSLAGPAPAKTRRPRPETVPASIRQLLGALALPAFVESRRFDVLAANPLAAALSPAMRAGENRMRSLFLDPAQRDLYPDWSKTIVGMVASFRASIGTDTGDPRVAQLVGQLSLASEEFRRIWARHDVRALAGGRDRLRHPELGDLVLSREKLPVGDTDGQILVIYHAEPGSASAAALGQLATAQPGPPAGRPAGGGPPQAEGAAG